MAKVVEVERREIPPNERVSLRYPAPIGTRALYRQVAKLEGLQHEVWIRDALWHAAKAALEKHGLDTSEMPDAHFPKPPRIQPRYDLSDLPEKLPQAITRRKRHREKAAEQSTKKPSSRTRSKPAGKKPKKRGRGK